MFIYFFTKKYPLSHIHTDPWWNPAVEDQASDRKHRIWQTRSVTIYRLIAEKTIEEKII